MYFKKEILPNIVTHTTSERTVQNWCDKNGVYINVKSDLSTYWAGFSNMYGQLHGLSHIEVSSFSYMVSMFMTGMGVSCGSEMYFREEDIEYRILKICEEISDIEDEERKALKLFYRIFDLYRYEIEKYSFKTNSLNFRLSQSDFDKFMGVDGDSKSDKLRNLLDMYYNK